MPVVNLIRRNDKHTTRSYISPDRIRIGSLEGQKEKIELSLFYFILFYAHVKDVKIFILFAFSEFNKHLILMLTRLRTNRLAIVIQDSRIYRIKVFQGIDFWQ